MVPPKRSAPTSAVAASPPRPSSTRLSCSLSSSRAISAARSGPLTSTCSPPAARTSSALVIDLHGHADDDSPVCGAKTCHIGKHLFHDWLGKGDDGARRGFQSVGDQDAGGDASVDA